MSDILKKWQVLETNSMDHKIFQIIQFVAVKFADPSNFNPFNLSSNSSLNSPHLRAVRKIPVQIREKEIELRDRGVKIGNSTLNSSFLLLLDIFSRRRMLTESRGVENLVRSIGRAPRPIIVTLLSAFFELKRRLNKSEANFSISRLRDRVYKRAPYIGVGRRGRIGINFGLIVCDELIGATLWDCNAHLVLLP